VLYTASSAREVVFVQELLGGTYCLSSARVSTVTDMFYAATMGGSADIFRLLLNQSMSPR